MAMMAEDRQLIVASRDDGGSVVAKKRRQQDWRVQTFFSQYYRRDVNQLDEEEEIVSQSSLYSDINLDIRRRGERIDFASRLSGGYRNDFLDNGGRSNRNVRLSYAYVDVADAQTRLQGRIGRQTRHSGGVLGRFDGINLRYDLNERIGFASVAGLPVNSVSDGTDSERTFYGVSARYQPSVDSLEMGLFFIQQNIADVRDRQAVGAEFRYYGENNNLWGLIDFDTSYSEISSAFLQGSLRFASRTTLHGSISHRHAPFLSMTTAMVGQPVASFEELRVLMTKEEIRQLSIDRSPLSTSYTAGLSQTLSPRLQLNVDLNQTDIDATTASGGVAATLASQYRYLSANLTASSIFKEGDNSLFGLRYSESGTTTVYSLIADTRMPFGRAWRISPRLRLDFREFDGDGGSEWLLSPGIRIQYRRSQRFRLDMQAGRQFAQRDSGIVETDRDSYFFNLGYQVFF